MLAKEPPFSFQSQQLQAFWEVVALHCSGFNNAPDAFLVSYVHRVCSVLSSLFLRLKDEQNKQQQSAYARLIFQQTDFSRRLFEDDDSLGFRQLKYVQSVYRYCTNYRMFGDR